MIVRLKVARLTIRFWNIVFPVLAVIALVAVLNGKISEHADHASAMWHDSKIKLLLAQLFAIASVLVVVGNYLVWFLTGAPESHLVMKIIFWYSIMSGPLVALFFIHLARHANWRFVHRDDFQQDFLEVD